MIVNIQPVQSWANGKITELNIIDIYGTIDNYVNGVDGKTTICWNIGNQTPVQPSGVVNTFVQGGNFDLQGQEYASWDGTNEWVINWVLQKLNLQRPFVGMVATPIPTSPLLKGGALPQ
jgi:hypothetical protein